MSQFLGMDTYRYVIEVLMSLLFKFSTSQYDPQSCQSVSLKFDEFLAESIHSLLVNFHSTKHFMFQSYLFKLFLFFNEENLQLPEMVLTDEINSNLFKYMNFLMAQVYKVFFLDRLTSVLPIMQESLKFTPDTNIGDWFPLEEHTIIRVYGFSEKPYLLLAFLTPRIFFLGVGEIEIDSLK